MALDSKKNVPLNEGTNNPPPVPITWGPWLFRITLIGTLAFMWWLVIYDHGVVTHH